jgi:hypothetical protein
VSNPDPHWFRLPGSGSGPRWGITTKKEKVKKCIVLKVRMFSFTLDFLLWSLIIFNFKIWILFSTVKFCNFWVRNQMVSPDPTPENQIQPRSDLKCWIRIRIESNANSQHWVGYWCRLPVHNHFNLQKYGILRRGNFDTICFFIWSHVHRYTVHLIVSRSWALNQSSTSDVSPSALHEQN